MPSDPPNPFPSPTGDTESGVPPRAGDAAAVVLSQAALAHALEQVPAPIAIVQGPELRFLLANAHFRQLAGSEDLVGRPFFAAVPRHLTEGTAEIFERVRAAGQPVYGREYAIPQGAETRYFDFVCAPLGSLDAILIHGVDVTAQVRGRQRAEQAEARLRAVLEQLPVGVLIAEAPSGRLVLANARAAELLGPLPERVAPPAEAPPASEAAPSASARVLDLLGRALWHGTVVPPTDLHYATADDDALWLAATAGPVYAARGERVAAIAAFSDATPRRRLAAEQAALAERLRLAQAAAGIVSFEWDLETDRVHCTADEHPFAGGARAATLEEFAQRLHPDDRARVIAEARAAAAAGRELALQYRVVRPDGTVREIAARGQVMVGPEGRRRMVGVNVDITEQQRAQHQLRQLAAASLAINAAPTTAERLRLTTEHARTIIGAHQAVTSLTRGPDWSQAISAVSLSDKYAAWRDYDAPPDGSGIYAEVCRTNRPMRLTQPELEAHPLWRGFGREAGRHPPLRGWLAVPLVGRDGRNLGLIQLSDKYEGEFTEQDEAVLVQLAQLAAVALETAALYEAEQAARAEAEAAVRARDEFLSIAAHELRTPVTGLKGAVQLLLRRHARGTLDPTRLADSLTLLDAATDRLTVLIDDLLDVSRIRAGRLLLTRVPTDLAALLRRAVAQLAEQAEAAQRIHLDLPPRLPVLWVDPLRIDQVLTNLLDNALKYSPQGGAVRVVAREADGGVLVRVEDHGIGLPPGYEERIFEPFGRAPNAARSNLPGMGLGLYICRNIVERHGGRIWAESSGEHAGATFAFWLPADPAAGGP